VRPRSGGQDFPLNLDVGDEFVVDVNFTSNDPDEPFHVAVTLDTLDGRCVLAASTKRDGADPVTGGTDYCLRFRVPMLPIATGTFHIYAFLLDESGLYNHDQVIITEAVRFSSPEWTPSLIEVEHQWERL
jgi:hypothetical protein